MGQNIAIRPYAAADLDALIELFRQSVLRIARKDYTEAQVLAWANAIDREAFATRREAKPTWIAEMNGVIAGFTDLEPDGHIDMLFVHPDSLRRGVAGALLDMVERTARQAKLARLYTEGSITARPVFECHGFRVITAQTAFRNGQDFTNYRMEKTLRL